MAHDVSGRSPHLTASDRRALRALLIGLTRRADDPASADAAPDDLARLAREAPIAQLPDAAILHRVSGTVLRGLDGIDGVSADVVKELRAAQSRSQLRHMIFLGALSEISDQFDAAGIMWLVMKGPVVAAELYQNPGDRTYGDLDLLVHRRDFAKAVSVLEEMGFRHAIHNWALAEEMLAGEISMETDSVVVDLHWNLHYDRPARSHFDLRPEEMLGRARQVSLGPMSAATFDAEDTLVALCFHAGRSDGHRLVWFKDIQRSLAVGSPDLDEVVRRSHDFRIGPIVGLMLARTRRILGAPVADDVIAALASPMLLRAERLACALVDPIQFDEDGTLTRLFTRSIRSTDLATLAAIPSRSVQLLQRRLFPPEENETDDTQEKESYFDAVAGSV